MSLPKLSDFMGKSQQNVEYKKVGVLHAINNSLARNIIPETNKPSQKTVLSKPITRFSFTDRNSPATNFNYEQKLSSSLLFSTDDLHKLLQHLFNKKSHDINDRNFIRRLLLKHFPQSLIYSANKNFISYLEYLKINKNQVIYPPAQNSSQIQGSVQKFYLILKGKVKIITDQNCEQKSSGQYFGQLEIMGDKFIAQIHAKTDTMLLTLNKQPFQDHFLHYFQEKYNNIFKRVSLALPIFNLVPFYNKLRILNLVQQKQFKTGQRIIQKGQLVKQLTFMNDCAMSSSEDRILNQYKVAGLTEIVSMQNPIAKDSVYCMENTYLFAIQVDSFLNFISREALQNFLLSNTALETMKNSKIPNEKQTICYDNSSKLQSFIRVKKVKFNGKVSRFVTQPSSRSISNITPKITGKKNNYPEYIASFVFLKKQAIKNQKSIKIRHDEIKKTQQSKYKELKEYFMKTRESLKKKRWLDQIQVSDSNSIIYNPQKTIERTRETLEQTL